MQDRVNLPGDRMIDLKYVRPHHRHDPLALLELPGPLLGDEFLDGKPDSPTLLLIAGQPAFFNDLIEKVGTDSALVPLDLDLLPLVCVRYLLFLLGSPSFRGIELRRLRPMTPFPESSR